MTMTKLFTMTFDEEMKSRGYKRKGRLYCKLVGEIFQGVALMPINPYDISFFAAPYWLYSAVPCSLDKMKKGGWVEYGFTLSPNSPAYYIEEYEAFNQDYMSACFELSKKFFLPIIEKVTDIKSYLDSFLPQFENPVTKEKVGFLKYPTSEIGERYAYLNNEIWMSSRNDYPILQYYFLYEAYLQRDFKAPFQRLTELVHKIIPELFDNKLIIEYQLGKYIKMMEKGDLDWIATYREQRREMIIPILRDHFKLNTFHL